jgi:uncharacterized membrane protein
VSIDEEVKNQRAEVQRLQKELKEQEDLNEAQFAKFEGCPHAQAEHSLCGCSFDNKDDVCAYHAPQLREALTEVERLDQQVRVLREALQTLVDQGEPLRYQFELWSNWQPRVREWKQARAALAETEPRP